MVTHFIGCNSPPPAYPAFLPGNTIVSVQIVFDEGIDTGPDFSGAVVLDNIDINTILVGRTKCLPSCP